MSGPHEREDALDARLAALVRGERAAMEPDRGAEARTWQRVASSVAAGSSGPAANLGGPNPSPAGLSLWIKAILGLLVVGAVAVGVQVAAQPEPADVVAVEPPTVPRSSPAPAAPSQPVEQPEVVPPAVSKPAAPAASKPAPKKARGAPPPAEVSSASDLVEETRLLARARARMRAGSPANALEPLSEHARRFPQGQLAEDRMVLRAQALCESGKLEAGRAAVAKLRAAFSGSSHLPRVERACGIE